jgi:hypothetical protein
MKTTGNSTAIFCTLLQIVPNQAEAAIRSAMRGDVPDLSKEPTLMALAEISVRLDKVLAEAEAAVRGEES